MRKTNFLGNGCRHKMRWTVDIVDTDIGPLWWTKLKKKHWQWVFYPRKGTYTRATAPAIFNNKKAATKCIRNAKAVSRNCKGSTIYLTRVDLSTGREKEISWTNIDGGQNA